MLHCFNGSTAAVLRCTSWPVESAVNSVTWHYVTKWRGTSVKHLVQKRRCQCLATSLAMVTGQTIEEIIERFGHDGLQVYWPDLQGCNRVIGHTPLEMVEVAYRLGVYLIPVITEWPACPGAGHTPHIVRPSSTWIEEMYNNHDGVLIGVTPSGSQHAVAWSCSESLVLDPNGTRYPRTMFRTEVFWASLNPNLLDRSR